MGKMPIQGEDVMTNISALAITKQLATLAKHYLAIFCLKSGKENSYAGEYKHLKEITTRLRITNGYVVDIAASDGYEQSCTLGFFKDPDWAGLAVEMDPSKFSKLAFLYASFPNAKLARGRITPKNVISLMRGFEVPSDFTLLNLDIDSYDLYVLDELLQSEFKPKIISMEVNEKIPPPIFFTVDFDEDHYWKGDHFYGCSLTAASDKVKPYGYKLESLQYNNAIFIRSDIANDLFEDLSVEFAYNVGYRNKPDRKKLFPWNSNVDCLLELPVQNSIDFLNDFFHKYKGKYTLR
jgi:hypothetical protein